MNVGMCWPHHIYGGQRTTLFETGSFAVYDCICQASQPKTFWGYCYVYSLSPIRSSEITEAIYHNQLYMSSRDLNSDLHVCVGSVTYWDISPILRFQVRIKHEKKIAGLWIHQHQIQIHYFKNVICNKFQKSHIIKPVYLCYSRLSPKNNFVFTCSLKISTV